MSVETNRALIRRLFDEVLNGGNTDALNEIISGEYVEHDALPGQEAGGAEGVRQRLAILREAFPDLSWHLQDLIAAEQKAVARWGMEATDLGGFMGMAPTGKRVSVSGIDVYRIANGCVAEHWQEMDTLGLMRQLGAVS
ncbi:ester cyclase [soil metagenome]